MKGRVVVSLFLGFVVLLLIGASNALPDQVWVDKTWRSQTDVNDFNPNLVWGKDAFSSIQQGICNVNPSGTVNVLTEAYDSAPLKNVWIAFLVPSVPAMPGAFVGSNYTVTIVPEATPSVPITTKPVFTTFSIESTTTDIDDVYYQIDSYTGNWTAIQSNVNAKTWYWPGWTISDAQWTNLSQGTHTFYFKFTRTGGGSTVGENGSISWQFFKSTAVSLVSVTQPNGGETLTREPYTIRWTLPTTSSLDYINIYYSRDGGTTYPYRIARVNNASSSVTSYIWRSPNIYTNRGRVKVVARYTNGIEYSDTSDANFNITKGYSFWSWRPWNEDTSFRVWNWPPFSLKLG
jgi:hypothetical protein